jgi:large subunit ribosomal protein L30
MLKITLTRGLVAKRTTQVKVVQALGLRKQNSSVVRADSPTIRGMINKVHHLVTVEPLENVKIEDVKKSKVKTAK